MRLFLPATITGVTMESASLPFGEILENAPPLFFSVIINSFTLRGAEVRDAEAWAHFILEAEYLFGDETDVVVF